jgi:hypothetical protein
VAGISIIPHSQQFVKRKVAQIFVLKNSQFCATLPIDFLGEVWYNNSVKREGLVNSPSGRCFSQRKFLEKSLKNLLTNPLKCGIIIVSRGE